MKLVAALVFAGLAATAVGLASASALDLRSSCESDGLSTLLRRGFDPARGYVVTGVAVSGISPRCEGHRLVVVLTGLDGAEAVEGGPLVVPPGGGTLQLPVAPQKLDSVARVHVVVQ